jgi:O-antigen/teichoic acid export membrane protein
MTPFRIPAPAAPETLDGVPAFDAALRRDYGSYLLSLGLINIGGLLMLPVVTAWLSAADLGLYSLVETARVQGITFSLLGLKFAYLYYYSKIPPEDRPGLFGVTLLLATAASLLGGLALWAVFGSASVMARFDSTPLPQAWLLVPLLMLGATQTILMTELRALRQAWLSGAIAFSQLVVGLAAGLLLLAVFDLGIAGLLFAELITGILVNAATLLLMRHRLHFRWHTGQTLALLRYGIPMMGSLVLRYSLDTLCRFLLAALVSIEAAGTFLIASRVSSIFDSLLALPFFTAWGGLVHHALRQPAAPTIIGRASMLALGLSSLLVLAVLAARPWLFDLLAHDRMPAAAGLFALLLLSRAVMLVRSPLTSGILVTGQTGWATHNSLLGLAVFLVLIYPLARLWQAEGMAAALLIANSVATGALIAQSRQHCRPQIARSALLPVALALTGAALSLTPAGRPAILAGLLGAALAGLLVVRRRTRISDTEPG